MLCLLAAGGYGGAHTDSVCFRKGGLAGVQRSGAGSLRGAVAALYSARMVASAESQAQGQGEEEFRHPCVPGLSRALEEQECLVFP